MLSNNMVQTFAIPSELMTKRLNFKSVGSASRKIVISTNWLVLFDFNANDRVVEQTLGKDKGIVIDRVYDLLDSPLKTKKVYSRNYKTRRNNPLETLMEVSSQKLINHSFPKNCSRVHVVFSKGRVRITPLSSHQEQAILNATPESMDQVFAACTSGVDLHAFEDNGFSIHSVLDYRPIEKRDIKGDKVRDLTETGALSVLRNLKNGIRNLFNEDISEIDICHLAKAVEGNPVSVFLASPQCDDFSPCKSKKARESSVNDLSSTADMGLDLLRIIDAVKPPVATFENVSGWYKSPAYELIKLRMRRWGYKENLLIADARDYKGLTSRKRGYVVFTCLPSEFSFESPTPRRTESIWPLIEPYLEGCREVSHSKSIQAGKQCGRLRVINKSSLSSPTFLKSQPRMAKDSCVLEVDGRYYFPSEELQKFLMGIPESFKTDCSSKDIGSEILGQSIDGSIHNMVIRSVKRHIANYSKSFFKCSKLALAS